jgi:hypothetical protein
MGASEITAMAASVAAVLSVVGGTLRYLVRMAAALERTSTQAASMTTSFERHVTASETFHAALTDRVTAHGEQLAALTARVETMHQ